MSADLPSMIADSLRVLNVTIVVSVTSQYLICYIKEIMTYFVKLTILITASTVFSSKSKTSL